MRQGSRRATAALVLVALVAGILLLSAADADARYWRSSRYGRRGAEIWIEGPRLLAATGKGYYGKYDFDPGTGFGFGLMFALSDNILIEGRLVQSNHTASTDTLEWDIDEALVGLRYVFFSDERWQPSIAAGGSRIVMELDPDFESSGDFQRLTGFGTYVSAGVDFIWSSNWTVLFRADYTMADYTHVYTGTMETDLEHAQQGNCFSVTLGLAYRIPMW